MAADPGSIPAKIALSYARQASFDLKGALDILEEAVRQDPQAALAWARLAEVQQMVDRVMAMEEGTRLLILAPFLLTAGLDAGRFGLSAMPLLFWPAGLVPFLAGTVLLSWSMGVNPFFEKTVRIQHERDHRVIDGADGARFMQWICQAIEYPLQLVM